MIAPGSSGLFLGLIGIGIFTAIGAVTSWIVGTIVDIATAIAAALAAVWAAVSPVFVAIWHSLSGIFDNVIKPVWDKVKAWGEQVWQAYTDHIKPIVDWIQNVACVMRKVYSTFIQPVRDIISALEQFLQLTGLANTAFGRWLDGELHRLDANINRVWEKLSGPVNKLMHLVNEVILDAHGILQAPLLLESTAAYMGTIAAQLVDKVDQLVSPDWGNVLDAFHKGPRLRPSVDNAAALVRDGSGDLAPSIDRGLQTFRTFVAEDYDSLDYLLTGTGPSSQTPGSA